MNIFEALINLNNPHQLCTAEALQIAFWAVTRCSLSRGRDVDEGLDLDMGLASIDLLKLLINAKKWGKGAHAEDEILWPLNGIRAGYVKGVRRRGGERVGGTERVSWLRSWQFHNCFHMQKIPVALERIISLASCVCIRLGLVSALRFHFIHFIHSCTLFWAYLGILLLLELFSPVLWFVARTLSLAFPFDPL